MVVAQIGEVESMKLNDLTFSYGDRRVLNGLNLEIEEGKTLALTGSSGTGKTTLLKILAGLLPCDGVPNIGRVSCVFQNDRLIPNLTVEQNIRFIEPNADVDALLSKVGLSDAKRRYPKELSGGMARRVAILRAFAFSAELVLLDEPFHNLDVALKYRIMDELKALIAERRSTAVLVTHTVEEAIYLADTIAVLEDGKISAVLKNGADAEARLLSILRAKNV